MALNSQIGTQILTIEGIIAKAEKGQSVYVKSWGKAVSAAFLISMQVRTLNLFIKSGCYSYTAKVKQPFNTKKYGKS